MSDCIFCKIAAGEIPANFIYQDDEVVAFKDTNPQAPVHILIIPKKHVANILEADEALLGTLFGKVKKIAASQGLSEKGFRTVVNTGDDGGQTVHHLHLHLLGGRFMQWPPG
ncbi:MAG: histidine triad nucleotide-binding protein [Spirochaetaceae bacterium]|jgi:histidine triad (HIT) family protein|nr:histidine triad nucleotide-binding protein [Spirochaetaceae bacterium]